jgi:hypothetical protein
MGIRKTAIISWILIHFSVLMLEVAPFKPGQGYPGKQFLEFYLQSTGLWQDWGMFSPEPLRLNLHVEAKIRYQNGGEVTYALPRLHRLPRLERILMERYRKWEVDWLRLDESRYLWSDGTRFILKQLPVDPGNPLESIRLIRRWHEIEDPRIRFREWGYRVSDSELTSFEFTNQKVDRLKAGSG